MTSLIGRLRRVNGSEKTASRASSRRHIGSQYHASNFSCNRTKNRATPLGGRQRPSSNSSCRPLRLKQTASCVRGRGLKLPGKNAALITAAFIGVYFYVTRDASQQEVVRISTTGGQVVERETQLPSENSRTTDSLTSRQYAEADQARAQAGAQVRPALAANSASEARQSLEKEHRLALEKEHRLVVLENELAEARRAIEARDLQIDARDRQLREMESELAMVRRQT
jgi:hypothetical protein